MLTRRTVLSGLAALPLLPGVALATENVALSDLYEDYSSREMFTPLARALDGQRIEVEGYMAPPLRAHSDFFIVTATPMAFCPFCSGGYAWPNDVLAIYTQRPLPHAEHATQRLAISGELRLGAFEDTENGLVSQARLIDARYRRV